MCVFFLPRRDSLFYVWSQYCCRVDFNPASSLVGSWKDLLSVLPGDKKKRLTNEKSCCFFLCVNYPHRIVDERNDVDKNRKAKLHFSEKLTAKRYSKKSLKR